LSPVVRSLAGGLEDSLLLEPETIRLHGVESRFFYLHCSRECESQADAMRRKHARPKLFAWLGHKITFCILPEGCGARRRRLGVQASGFSVNPCLEVLGFRYLNQVPQDLALTRVLKF